MKVLWACQKCGKQHDISRRPLGSSFHCSCSATIQVPQTLPSMKEIATAHCGSCGATRNGTEALCRFCSSAFKKFELDRHTMCPHCFVRISDSSSFCHGCGKSIEHPLAPVEIETAQVCPTCTPSTHLMSRKFESVIENILECPHCSGLFLTHSSLHKITHHSHSLRLKASKPLDSDLESKQKGPFYRKCPSCSRIMHRKNFAQRSGIIVDFCADHGIWLDDNELQKIVEWIKAGGADLNTEKPSHNLVPPPATSENRFAQLKEDPYTSELDYIKLALQEIFDIFND